MPVLAMFVISVLLLGGGIFTAVAAGRLPAYSILLWLTATILLVLGMGLLIRRLGRGYLVLAVPLAALVAHGGLQRIWPTGEQVAATAPVASNHPAPAVQSPAGDGLTKVVLEVPPALQQGRLSQTRELFVPPGWKVSVFAGGLGKARMLALAADGTLLVSVPDRGMILALPDRDENGIADETVPFASGLESPHGLSVSGSKVWIAGTGRLWLAVDADGDLRAETIRELSRDVPGGGGHWTRSLARGPDGKLYLSAGSSCNACLEEDSRRGTVMVFPDSGGKGEVFAFGLRNSVGLAFHPGTGELWGSDNGRDMLGDDLPPDEINRIVSGGDYGWPYCYGQRIADPEHGSERRCEDTLAAAVDLQAHSAPLGISFSPAGDYPPGAEELLLVAYHGSWNRSVPTGYKLVGIPFRHGRPAGSPVDLARGWLREDGEVWGRPVAPLVGRDGAWYLSDDYVGAVYRITRPTP